LTSRQKWTLALTSAAALMVALDQLVVATALSTIQRDLHASVATLEWTVNAYTLTFAVLLITGAAVGNRFGRRRAFVGGLGLFTLASVACAVAPDTGLLVAARTVQGAGSALVMPAALALLTGAFPAERRGAAVGVFTALTGLAVVGGPVVGGAVTEGIAWQWIFWINVPIGAVLVPLGYARIAESRGARTRPDLVGLVLVSAGMLGIVWGLVRSTAAGWASSEVVTTLVAGAAVTAAFVAWEARATAPMVPLRLFADRTFSAANATIFLLTAGLFSTVFFFAQYLQVTLGASPLGAGLRFLPWTLTLFVVAPAAGRLADRIGDRAVLAVGVALQAAGLGWVALVVANGDGYAALVPAVVLAGCGTSMALPASQNAVMNSVRPADVGAASGVFTTFRQLGGVFGIAILAAVFAARGGSYAGAEEFRTGVAPALAVAAGLSVLGTVAAVAIRPRAAARTVTAAPVEAVAGG
jgi:EmrB/QacA subfamily drug resistance transporter